MKTAGCEVRIGLRGPGPSLMAAVPAEWIWMT